MSISLPLPLPCSYPPKTGELDLSATTTTHFDLLTRPSLTLGYATSSLAVTSLDFKIQYNIVL